jgi:2-polyprenyl-3-methyl-5-hydroxy-6-metoxy-1,4-benzoquinol methylase
MKYDSDEHVETTKKTYAQIARDYAHRNAQPNAAVQKMLDKFIALVPGKTVLDVGCAEGRESAYLSEQGLSVTGCDLSEEFIKMAKKQCPEGSFFVADMRYLPKDIGVFDGIWASASFLHIPKADALSTLRGFNKLLKRGGLLYVSVLEGDFDDTRTNPEMRWSERHFSDYRKDELSGMLTQAGFTLVAEDSNQRENGRIFLNFFCRK